MAKEKTQEKDLDPKDVTEKKEVILENIIQVINVYNQAIGIANQKNVYTDEDSDLILQAKRFANGYTTKEKLKLNFNNSFFQQTKKENEKGQTVYNFEPVELTPTKSSKRTVKIYEIEEDVLLFANDQIMQAKKGDTVLEYKGTLFFEPQKEDKE